MKVLVTGMDGYIGAQLAPLLVGRGHDVVGIDTGFYGDGRLYDPSASHLPLCTRKDLRTITEEDIAGYDTVVHLAELSNDPLGQLRPKVTYEINYEGTVELARKCKRAGVLRFVMPHLAACMA